MASDSVLDSDLSTGDPGPDEIRTALASIPDQVDEETAAEVPAAATPELLQPWAAVDVAWLVPLAGKLVQLPYEQAAKVTRDDCWLVTDDQLALLNPSLENAIKWGVWRLGAANMVSHPLIAFAVAMGSLTAVKYGVYKVNQLQQKEGAPQKSKAQHYPVSTPTDSLTGNGRMEESAGASSSQASQGAAKAGSSPKEYVVYGE